MTHREIISEELRQYLDSGKKFIALDGLRGWAIVLVIFFHVAFNGFPFNSGFTMFFYNFGWSGVDLFFVISGFLITNILLQSKTKKHYFKNFYFRRILRIFPLYYAFLIFNILFYKEINGVLYQVFYLSNFYLASVENIPAHTPAWLTWSLSIEEQFYLLWPALIYFLRRKVMIFLTCFFIVAALFFRIAHFYYGVQPFISYVSFYARIDAIALGSLISLLINVSREYLYLLRKIAFYFLFIIPIFLYLIFDQNKIFYYVHSWGTVTYGFSLLAMLYAAILILTITSKSRLSELLFKNRLIVLIGKHSYCMYLIHNEWVFFWK
ncbi:MAG TPA: acyltransferase, partial [Candidatus Omnitrophota bacterium]|nr:acyltransferase [Candidatus Omnitrophota bacterium]